MKLTPDQQHKRNKLEKILRIESNIVFEDREVGAILDYIVVEQTNKVIDIILNPYQTLLDMKIIDPDGEYSYRNNKANI